MPCALIAAFPTAAVATNRVAAALDNIAAPSRPDCRHSGRYTRTDQGAARVSNQHGLATDTGLPGTRF